jgi:hypothetical protein
MTKQKRSDKKSKPEQSASSTVVNFRLDEPRKSVGFKCNKKLWKAFVSFSKQNYGSVCHVLEPMMIAILTSRVNLSETLKPLHVENLNVSRVVKRVRRISEEIEVAELEHFCFECGSNSDLVYAQFVSGKKFVVCCRCLENVKRLKLTLKKVLMKVI